MLVLPGAGTEVAEDWAEGGCAGGEDGEVMLDTARGYVSVMMTGDMR